MLANYKLSLLLTGLLLVAFDRNVGHCQDLPPLAKVQLNPLTTLKKKHRAAFFSRIQAAIVNRWKLKVDGSAHSTVAENSIEVAYSKETKPRVLVSVYLRYFSTAERAARHLRKISYGMRRLLSSYRRFHKLVGLADEAYAYTKGENTIAGRCANVTFEVNAFSKGDKRLAHEVVKLIAMHVESGTPQIFDVEVSDTKKASYAARLVADYALTRHGVKQVNERGLVTKMAGNKWTVKYVKLGRRVTIHALSSDDTEFKRLDKNKNGQIDGKDFSPKARQAFVFRIPPYNKKDKLPEAADLLRRIDMRIGRLQGKHAGLSSWNKPIKTIKRKVYSTTYVEPDANSSGKLLQINYVDINRRHRLIYRNRRDPCSFSIRVISASTGYTYSIMPAHSNYARSWVLVKAGTVRDDEKLRKKIIRIIQQELFKEPGSTGIEKRAWFSATALAHLAKSKKFRDMRWGRPHDKWFYDIRGIVRVDKQLIFLCMPPTLRVGFNPSLPITVKVH